MSRWIKYPASWHLDERIEDLSGAAIALYVFMIGHCGQSGSEGHLTVRKARRLRPESDFAAALTELTRENLVEVNQDGGLFLPEWSIHLLPNDYYEAKREAGRKGGMRSGAARRSRNEASAQAPAQANAKPIRSEAKRALNEVQSFASASRSRKPSAGASGPSALALGPPTGTKPEIVMPDDLDDGDQR